MCPSEGTPRGNQRYMIRWFRPSGVWQQGEAREDDLQAYFGGKSGPNLPQICQIWALLTESVGLRRAVRLDIEISACERIPVIIFHPQCTVLLLVFQVLASLPTRAFPVRLQPSAQSRISTPKSGLAGSTCCLPAHGCL